MSVCREATVVAWTVDELLLLLVQMVVDGENRPLLDVEVCWSCSTAAARVKLDVGALMDGWDEVAADGWMAELGDQLDGQLRLLLVMSHLPQLNLHDERLDFQL